MGKYKSFEEMWSAEDDQDNGDESLVPGLVEEQPDYGEFTNTYGSSLSEYRFENGDEYVFGLSPTHDPIVNQVITRMTDRSKEGMVKFGQTMAECDKPTVDWIDDTIEELLDAACYLERLKKNV